MAQITDVSTQRGRIWEQKPEMLSDGLFAEITHQKNRRVEINNPYSLLRCAFNCHGDVFACVDRKGDVFVFLVSQNR